MDKRNHYVENFLNSRVELAPRSKSTEEMTKLLRPTNVKDKDTYLLLKEDRTMKDIVKDDDNEEKTMRWTTRKYHPQNRSRRESKKNKTIMRTSGLKQNGRKEGTKLTRRTSLLNRYLIIISTKVDVIGKPRPTNHPNLCGTFVPKHCLHIGTTSIYHVE